MAKTIQQSVKLSAKPNKVYALYMDPKQHSAVTGKPAKVGKKVGGSVTASNGAIKGKLLHLVKNKQIVQTWRAGNWSKADSDSVLTITFSARADGGTDVQLVHANVPDSAVASVKQGWSETYFAKWKEALAPKAKAKPAPKAKKPAKKAAKPAAKAAAKTVAKKAAKPKAKKAAARKK